MGFLKESLEIHLRNYKAETIELEKVVDSIFKECKMKGQFFLFFDIPEHLIKLKLQKPDLQNTL